MMSSEKKIGTKHASVLILDDDEFYRLELEIILEQNGYTIWLSTDSPDMAMDTLVKTKKDHQPTVILLDVRLNDKLDGIAMAANFAALQIPYIYLTAYPNEVQFQKALKTHPAAYLLKPVSGLELHHAIQVAINNTSYQWPNADPPKHNPVPTVISNASIKLKDRDNVYRKVAISKIYAVEAYGNFLLFYTSSERYTLRETLKKMEQLLEAHHFVRIHRRYLISIAHWEKKLPLHSHILVAGKKFPTGRGYRKKLRTLL